VATQVERAPTGAVVCIYLAQARTVDDRGVVALSEAVRGRAVSAPVRLLGLRRHHVRVLRYHGADVARLGLGPALVRAAGRFGRSFADLNRNGRLDRRAHRRPFTASPVWSGHRRLRIGFAASGAFTRPPSLYLDCIT